MGSLRDFQDVFLPARSNQSIAEQADCPDNAGVAFVRELNKSGERDEY